jgi:malonyl-CoA/methylmalonyl-CoA synthetase
MANISEIRLIERAKRHQGRVAIIDTEGSFTYDQLIQDSGRVASCLLDGVDDLREARVAFMTPPGFHYVAVLWGIWRAGGIAVPLSIFHPRPELEHVIKDSEASMVISHPDFEERSRPMAKELGLQFILTTDALRVESGVLPDVNPSQRAMILYTSGTTSKPKGVVITHKNLEAQVMSLVQAWEWVPDDHILHVLPLHHIHGITNALICALWAGATCEILPKFDAKEVWERFIRSNLTLFMAVPTIYNKLISFWEASSVKNRRAMSCACSKFRLMVSGSAALPVSVMEKWKAISDHTLLERYGLTESGMVLSNPLHGQRVPGFVGSPLPNIEVRLVDEKGNAVKPGIPGEVQVKGPGIFHEYWKKPEATQQAFEDGWFRTGDVAIEEKGIFRILGRSSVDIIKTGGYKVSVLEIEEVLQSHPDIKACAVVGIEDPEWGERVSAALVLDEGSKLSLDSLRKWAKERLAPYKIPTRLCILDDLPRNIMGKISKPEIVRLFKAKELGQ